ncbi:MAG: SRPBCC domain-containing protein [Nevskia sp.]|nr:SRPBCC domain-containing protein [Nevskia sp.]
MSYAFTLTATIPAPPEEVYAAWLDSRRHSRMTGGKAVMSLRPGARVSAWDGYISGRNLELVPGKRIVQTWRTSEFSDADADSIIRVSLRPVRQGTRLRLRHSQVPDGHTGYELGGWENFYFKPMREYFAARRARAAAVPARRGTAKKPRPAGVRTG